MELLTPLTPGVPWAPDNITITSIGADIDVRITIPSVAENQVREALATPTAQDSLKAFIKATLGINVQEVTVVAAESASSSTPAPPPPKSIQMTMQVAGKVDDFDKPKLDAMTVPCILFLPFTHLYHPHP